MLKIRLMRIGAKKQPFYRVVVVDERAKRTGAYIELLGTYNPLTEPKEIKLKQDRIDHWVKQGAQFSTGYLRIIGKAPQRLPRKPKKEKKEPSTISNQPASQAERGEPSEKPAEEPIKETPMEMTKPEAEVDNKGEDVKAGEASLTGEQANIEPAPESEKKNEGSA